MDAKNELSRFVQDYLAIDPDVIAAKQRLDAATAARQALVDRFNKDLANDEQYKTLLAAISDAQTQLAAIAADINAAEARRAAAEAEIARLQAQIADQQAQLAAAQSDYTSYGTAAGSTWYEMTTCQAEIVRLCERQRWYRSRCEWACTILRRNGREWADAEHRRHWMDDHERDRDRDRGWDHDRDHDRAVIVAQNHTSFL